MTAGRSDGRGDAKHGRRGQPTSVQEAYRTWRRTRIQPAGSVEEGVEAENPAEDFELDDTALKYYMLQSLGFGPLMNTRDNSDKVVVHTCIYFSRRFVSQERLSRRRVWEYVSCAA
ncbi:hypothetical protein PENSPDRAFT_735229 [Peniophora sp. CONT]|nr:hypothetical protein PENSPDRAFT_735229 [Peniophora sp. CONT]